MEFENSALDGSPATVPLTQDQLQGSFQPMQYASSSIKLPDSTYRVFTGKHKFEEVEASSAYEAMQKTGIKNPMKIQRHSLNRIAVLTDEILSSVEAKRLVAVAKQLEAAEEAIDTSRMEAYATGEMPTEEDAATRGLEDGEVDKLLDQKE